MSKEWQEASNEYALVRISCFGFSAGPDREKSLPCVNVPNANPFNRKRRSTPSTVSARRVTKERASFRAPLLRSHRCCCPTGCDPISQERLEGSVRYYGDLRHVVLDGSLCACSHFLSFLASIRKCVYSVLCYNQCISFVAIEKYV